VITRVSLARRFEIRSAATLHAPTQLSKHAWRGPDSRTWPEVEGSRVVGLGRREHAAVPRCHQRGLSSPPSRAANPQGRVRKAKRYEIAESRAELANWLMAQGRGMMGVMVMHFTAVFKKVPEGYVAYVEELPGANTQGTTMDEARDNLREAVQLVLEANRELSREELGQGEVIREDLGLAIG
jgi:predicted RNase H-like HicB family nuclease